MSDAITLSALDGANPLGFLTAVGTLRLLQLASGNIVRMRWERHDAWRPCIEGGGDTHDEVCARVLAAPHVPIEAVSQLGKNITVDAKTFAQFVDFAAAAKDRRAADYAAAFGSEVRVDDKKDQIQRTDFCFITGSGHQHFIGTMEALAEAVTVEHIRDALFGSWIRERGLSMRWDPRDASEYALRWSDPGPEGASAVWGANRLAVEALPLFPTQPTASTFEKSRMPLMIAHGLQTTGFRRERRKWPQFSWPIWTGWATVDTVRSLISLKELQAPDDEFTRGGLQERGIEEVYRAQRVRIGQGANFKLSFRPSRAI
jgi:hypothetical protein